jgi:hypothetical protein
MTLEMVYDIFIIGILAYAGGNLLIMGIRSLRYIIDSVNY